MRAIDKREWMFPTASAAPRIFDINLAAVDQERDGWTQVKMRMVNVGPQKSLMGISLGAALMHPPPSRAQVKGLPTHHFTKYEMLPTWMQERIAILNIADADRYIPGIGIRWTWKAVSRTPSPHGIEILDKRYYTLTWNCKGGEGFP
jgi:hypothetical protein